MKRHFSTLTLLATLVTLGCQKNIQKADEPNDSEIRSGVAKGPSPATGTVYLTVTVDDSSPHMILSDNSTPYIHGRDRVEAQLLSSDGNFYMNTNNNTVKPPVRTMQFLPGWDVDLSGNRNYSLRTSAPQDPAINGGNTVWIQNLAVGQSQLMSFRAWGVEQQGVVDWKLLFRNGPENNSFSLTDYVRVTRTASNPDTWTIEPAGISSPAANARLVNANDIALGSEYYPAPFRLTLSRK
jgi:hypothetical protein